MATIKQMLVNSVTYDLSAKYLLDKDGNEQTYENITSLIEAGAKLETVTKNPATMTQDELATHLNKIMLYKANTTPTDNQYDEYIVVGTAGAYSAEKIGTTVADLVNYQKTGIKLETTTNTDGVTTGSSGVGTVTVSTATATTGEVTGSVTYLGPEANTGASAELKTNYTPDGTISNITIAGHSHEFYYNTEAVSNLVSFTQGALPTGKQYKILCTPYEDPTGRDVVQSVTSSTESVINSLSAVTLTTQSIPSGYSYTASSIKTNNYGFTATTSSVMYSPTVSDGVLSWSVANANTAIGLSAGTLTSSGTATVVTSTAASLSLAAATGYGTVSVVASIDASDKVNVWGANEFNTQTGYVITGLGSLATLTTSQTTSVITEIATTTTDDSWTRVSTSSVSATTVTPTFTGKTATISLGTHSHSIGTTAMTTSTVSLLAAIGAHTHTVTIGEHTHAVAAHTHFVTTSNTSK